MFLISFRIPMNPTKFHIFNLDVLMIMICSVHPEIGVPYLYVHPGDRRHRGHHAGQVSKKD